MQPIDADDSAGTERESKFKRHMEEAVVAYITLPTIEVAAQSLGIHRNTLRVWINRPEFQAKLNEFKQEHWERAVAKAYEKSPDIITHLCRIATDPDHPKAADAGKTVVAMLQRGQETAEMFRMLENANATLEQYKAERKRLLAEQAGDVVDVEEVRDGS